MKHPKRPPITLRDFFENEVRPALAAGLASAFPEFGFRRGRGEWWTATTAPSGFEDYGVRERKLTANAWGLRSFKSSAVDVPWTAYVLGRTDSPRGADFVEAVKTLAQRLGLDASVLDRERTPEQVEEDHKRVRRGDLLEDFVAEAHAVLVEEAAGKTARDYLTRRGFKAEDFEGLAFGVYTSPKNVEDRLKALGYTAEEVEASGLITTSKGDPLNLWTGRVVFPWRDERGRIVTVAARDTTGKVEDSKKYLYLRDHEKGTAFGLDVAVRSETARREGLVLVEGLLDVVLLQALGVDNVAALGGAGDLLTAERWERLARLRLPSFVLVLDNDEAGRKGLGKALDNLSNVDNVPNVYVIDPSELGAAKDPDELVRTKGLDAFRAVLKARRPWVSWRGEALLGNVNAASVEGERRDAAGRVLDFVEAVRGPRVTLDQEELLRLTSERTGYSFEALNELAADQAARRRREDAEKAVASALRTAQADLSKGVSVEDVVVGLEEGLAHAHARTEDAPPLLSIDRVLEETRNEPDGLVSGWAAVDAMGVRFTPGELALLAGRVGHAKTSLMVNLLKNWLDAKAVDGLVVFYSMEEPEPRIVHRLFALETCKLGAGWTAPEVRAYLKNPKGTNPHAQDGAYPDEDCLLEAIDRVRASMEGRLQIVWRPSWDVKILAAHARERAALGPVGAVLVDYLQRVPPTPGFKADRRDQEVSYIGRTLKTLAVDLGVPVVAGAQINREAVKTLNPDDIRAAEDFYAAIPPIRKARPELHHLREGGSEQEADLVLGFLNYAADYRTDDTKKSSTPAVTLLEVGTLKNREGEVGAWAALAWEGRYRFVRDAEDQEAESWKVDRAPSAAKRDESRTRRAELKVEAEREKTARAEKARQTAELKASAEKARGYLNCRDPGLLSSGMTLVLYGTTFEFSRTLWTIGVGHVGIDLTGVTPASLAAQISAAILVRHTFFGLPATSQVGGFGDHLVRIESTTTGTGGNGAITGAAAEVLDAVGMVGGAGAGAFAPTGGHAPLRLSGAADTTAVARLLAYEIGWNEPAIDVTRALSKLYLRQSVVGAGGNGAFSGSAATKLSASGMAGGVGLNPDVLSFRLTFPRHLTDQELRTAIAVVDAMKKTETHWTYTNPPAVVLPLWRLDKTPLDRSRLAGGGGLSFIPQTGHYVDDPHGAKSLESYLVPLGAGSSTRSPVLPVGAS